jgi:zona occludens toxin
MSIYLNTGVPGSGKTLAMVEDLRDLIKSWEKHPEKSRPILVHGITDLALPHSPLPMLSVDIDKAGTQAMVPDWDAVPDGSLVIIDEAQNMFPPRSSQARMPPHVAFLNVHRHRGLDIWLTTQLPKFVDGNVRGLVGRHRFYRRLFGKDYAVVYEWDRCSDNHNNLDVAVKKNWSYPNDIFTLYKSAEIHTKQEFRLPKWLLTLIIGPILCIAGLGYGYYVWNHRGSTSAQKSEKLVQQETGAQPVAAIAATQRGTQFAGYFRSGTVCYGVSRQGDIATEPPGCSDQLK